MIVLWRCRLISASNWFHNFCCISGSNFISFSLIKSWSCWTRPESSFAVYFPANLAPITSPVREGMIWKLESSVMMRKSLKFNDYGLIGCVGPFNQFSFIRKFHYKQRNKLCPRPNHNASSSSHQHFFSLATTTTNILTSQRQRLLLPKCVFLLDLLQLFDEPPLFQRVPFSSFLQLSLDFMVL